MLRLCQESKDARQEVYNRASRDPVWWYNTFAYTFDPRLRMKVVPFILYPFQEHAVKALDWSIAYGDDLLVEKSRDMGASWLCLGTFTWRWLFRPHETFLLVSRVEDLVDKKNDPDSLFWKIDFLLKYLPGWMRPNYERQKLSLTNLDNNSTIVGSSTTGETSRGGRKTAILLDEFAAVPDGHAMLRASRDATNCRIFNSTPQGTGNAFYDVRQKMVHRRRVMRLHWTLHPVKAFGRYQDASGKDRSPWYDKQCERAAHQQEIGQELDIDYLNSAWQFFDGGNILRLIDEHAQKPFVTIGPEELGEMLGLREELRKKLRDPLLLWCTLGGDYRPSRNRDYAIGCDLATGKDGERSSQSVASIGDKLSGEKVGMFCARNLFPNEFAEVCCKLGEIFAGTGGQAYLGWEANGPGGQFGKQVLDLHYGRVYYRQNEGTSTRRKLEFMGWWSHKDTKKLLLGQYATAVMTGTFVNRSRDALMETLEYVHAPNGDVYHAKSADKEDPTSSGENHGDMVIADAVLNLLLKETAIPVQRRQPKVEPGSYAHRMMQQVRNRRGDRMFEPEREQREVRREYMRTLLANQRR